MPSHPPSTLAKIHKTIVIGLSGPSSSGKTTLARHLRSIFDLTPSPPASAIKTSILHEDDFYKTDTQYVLSMRHVLPIVIADAFSPHVESPTLHSQTGAASKTGIALPPLILPSSTQHSGTSTFTANPLPRSLARKIRMMLARAGLVRRSYMSRGRG